MVAELGRCRASHRDGKTSPEDWEASCGTVSGGRESTVDCMGEFSVGSRREKLEGKEQLASYVREYVTEVKGLFQKICEGIFAFMDSDLVPLKHFGKLKTLDAERKTIRIVRRLLRNTTMLEFSSRLIRRRASTGHRVERHRTSPPGIQGTRD